MNASVKAAEDEEDDILDASEEEFRERLAEQLRKARVEDEEDLGGFDAPPTANVTDTTVSAEQGFDLAEKARGPAPKAEDKPVTDIDAMIDAKPEADPDPSAPAVSYDAMLAGLDEPRRAEITQRLTAADEVLDVFKGHEAEMKMHGNLTPAQATARMVQLNAFAQDKPDEYLAWVAMQINAESPQDVLSAAAAHLGFKLVPSEEEDEFEDAEKKALREENKRLKGSKVIGPDAPQNVVATQGLSAIQQYLKATDADGNLLHPYADKFNGEVVAKITEFKAANPDKIPTAADLSRFYREVAPPAPKPAKADSGSTATPAAQVPAPVTAKPSDAARRAEKSERASKMIDGSGPGSDRRPALTGDALLRSQIKDALEKNKG